LLFRLTLLLIEKGYQKLMSVVSGNRNDENIFIFFFLY